MHSGSGSSGVRSRSSSQPCLRGGIREPRERRRRTAPTNWSVTGAESAGTAIDDNGFLTIGEDETASALTVVAAMTVTRTGSDGAETVETYSDSTTVIVTAPGASDEEEEETGADPALVGGAKEDAAQPTNTPAPSESPRPAETNSSTSDTLLPEQMDGTGDVAAGGVCEPAVFTHHSLAIAAVAGMICRADVALESPGN